MRRLKNYYNEVAYRDVGGRQRQEQVVAFINMPSEKKKPGQCPVSRIQAYDYYYACSAVSTTSSATTGRSTNETIAICALSPVRTPHFRIRR